MARRGARKRSARNARPGPSKSFGVRPEQLHEVARSAFAAESSGLVPMPSSTFYYDDALHDDGGWKLVDTGRPPLWR